MSLSIWSVKTYLRRLWTLTRSRATQRVAAQSGWDWLGYNCSIAIPDVQVLSSGASLNNQSYSRIAALVPWSLERALKSLGMDHADILLLGLWNKDVSPAIFDQALRLRERGLIRAIAVSTHNRPQAAALANHKGDVDVLHVRYNAVHPGAERDIFPKLPAPAVRPGIVAFTATCWGDLMKPDNVSAGERIPSADDCYRFNLTNPAVDLCLTGPRSVSDLTAALDALDKGPMTTAEMNWMRRIGQAKYFKPSLFSLKG